MSDLTKILLDESEIPTHWYNIVPDLPSPPPPVLHPGTHEPVGPDDLAPLFPMDLILQEVSQDSYVEIPEEVREIYKLWRPSPLYRARRLEKLLETPARIYYKYEGVSPAGSHKPNTRGAAGVLQRQGRRQEAHHRDRRRAVGERARVCLPDVRHRMRGVAGCLLLRNEAVSEFDDAHVGR